MNRCPCEQCITFVICMIQVRNMKQPDITQFSGKKPCQLLQDYIYDGRGKGNPIGNELKIDATRKLFGIGTLCENYKGYTK